MYVRVSRQRVVPCSYPSAAKEFRFGEVRRQSHDTSQALQSLLHHAFRCSSISNVIPSAPVDIGSETAVLCRIFSVSFLRIRGRECHV